MNLAQPLSIAIQMDPIESINIEKDTTFLIALEAQRRGHWLYYYQPTQLSWLDDQVIARGYPLEVRPKPHDFFSLGEESSLNLNTVDVILMRQDPPFDMAYITTTHLLEHLAPHVLVINDPVGVRNAPEKLLVTHFPDLIPATLITRDRIAIEHFRTQYQDIVIKTLFDAGGRGVFHIAPQDENFTSIIEILLKQDKEPILIQRYLPEIRLGDKRIILFDGQPVGSLLRIPRAGEARANLHVGGTAKATHLTPREQEICHRIGPTLCARDLLFAGIDVIGDYLIEINVTSPTGLHEINRFNGIFLEAQLMDIIEKRVYDNREKRS